MRGWDLEISHWKEFWHQQERSISHANLNINQKLSRQKEKASKLHCRDLSSLWNHPSIHLCIGKRLVNGRQEMRKNSGHSHKEQTATEWKIYSDDSNHKDRWERLGYVNTVYRKITQDIKGILLISSLLFFQTKTIKITLQLKMSVGWVWHLASTIQDFQ